MAYVSRGIYIGSGGTVVLMTLGGSIATFFNCVAGTILPVRAVKVFGTGTTAGGLVNLV